METFCKSLHTILTLTGRPRLPAKRRFTGSAMALSSKGLFEPQVLRPVIAPKNSRPAGFSVLASQKRVISSTPTCPKALLAGSTTCTTGRLAFVLRHKTTSSTHLSWIVLDGDLAVLLPVLLPLPCYLSSYQSSCLSCLLCCYLFSYLSSFLSCLLSCRPIWLSGSRALLPRIVVPVACGHSYPK